VNKTVAEFERYI